MMARSVCWLIFFALFGGCTARTYRGAVETLVWPTTSAPKYTVSDGETLTLTKHLTGEVVPLPFMTRKVSAPVPEHIRFSTDGALLFVPIREDLFAPNRDPLGISYRLSVWDLERDQLVKTIDIDEALLTSR